MLSSDRAIELIEEVRGSQRNRIGDELWSWGYSYESEMHEKHRWEAGDLFAYWNAVPEEAAEVKEEFDKFRGDIEELDEVAGVDVTPYEIIDDPLTGLSLVGEDWRIRFKQEIVYTHREQQPVSD